MPTEDELDAEEARLVLGGRVVVHLHSGVDEGRTVCDMNVNDSVYVVTPHSEEVSCPRCVRFQRSAGLR